jgi:hypothetical protein
MERVTTLHDLIQIGALKSALQSISLDSYPGRVASQTEFKAMNEDEKRSFKGLVVIDGAQWYATVRGADPTLAKKIYSGDGGLHVGVWNREAKKYFLTEIIDGKICTVEKISTQPDTSTGAKAPEENKVKENSTMAETNMSLLDEFGENALKDIKNESKPAVSPVEVAADAKEKTEAQKNREAKEKEIAEIKTKVSGQELADRSSVISKNQKLGRLIAYVTKTDSTVKVSKKQVVKMLQGKPALKADAPETIKAEHDAGKKVPTKYFQKRTSACLRNTNPGSVIGTVIATPIGGCFDLNDLSNPEKRYEFDEKHTDLQYKYHPIEETYIVLSAWYDGKIKEDEVNMGANATTVQLVNTVVAARKNEETSKPKVRAKLVQNKDVRKSLLIPGNYFPAKVYETITYQNLSAKDAAELNYNFESMLKNDDDGSILAQLNESSTNNIVRTATGVTSDVFAEGKSAGPATFGEIPTYYDKTKNLTEVKIAKRDKKASKGKSGVFTYPFIYHKLDDREQGPFAIPEFKKVFDSFHIDEDKFISAVDKSTKTTRTSSSKVTLSNDDFLRAALLGGDIIQGVGSPISKIQENLLDIFN